MTCSKLLRQRKSTSKKLSPRKRTKSGETRLIRSQRPRESPLRKLRKDLKMRLTKRNSTKKRLRLKRSPAKREKLKRPSRKRLK